MNHEAFKKVQMTATRQEGCKSLYSLTLQAAADTGPYFSYLARPESKNGEKSLGLSHSLSKRIHHQMMVYEKNENANERGYDRMQPSLSLSISIPLESSCRSLRESCLAPPGTPSSLRSNSVWVTSCSLQDRMKGDETLMESRHGRSRANFTSSLTRPEIRQKKVNPDLSC
jgi:hypothetical protein